MLRRRLKGFLQRALSHSRPHSILRYSCGRQCSTVQIKGFGHFNPQPPSVRMRFMKTINGLMYDFDTRVMLVDSQTGSEHSLNLLSPDRKPPPFHTSTVSMRSFDLHATVPLSPSYHIKVEHDNWQQLCHVSTYQVGCIFLLVHCPIVLGVTPSCTSQAVCQHVLSAFLQVALYA